MPSICPGCSTGCNISVEAYQNKIARFKPRQNEAVNSHWICDEGRYCFHELAGGERLTTPMIRQEGGLCRPRENALQAVYKGLVSISFGGDSVRPNTNEEAYLFAKLVKKVAPDSALEVFYQERVLSDVQKVLMSPDRSPNCRGARDMGVSSNGGFDSLIQKLVSGAFASAYVVGEDLIATAAEPEKIRPALQKLSFLVVQDTHLSETAKLAHLVLPSTNFAEKEGTYTNRKGRVQRINAALVPPEGALQDCDIFARLLVAAGETDGYASAEEIFTVLAQEIPAIKA
jgi:NADH-quinone oxidoreductase subunit G